MRLKTLAIILLKQLIGGYVTAAYNFLPHITGEGSDYCAFFVRYENVDPQADVPAGNTDKKEQKQIYQFGLTYKPNDAVALKFDYQDWENESDEAKHRSVEPWYRLSF